MSSTVYQIIQDKITAVATRITRLHFDKHPELLECYGPASKERCIEDAVYHLEFLIEALKMDYREIYGDYILWAASMLGYRNIPASDLRNNLQYLLQALQDELGTELTEQVKPFIEHARIKLSQKVTKRSSYITEDNPYKNEAKLYLEYLLDGKRDKARASIDELILQGATITDIYQYIFQQTQYEVGHLWQCNTITVAHEHYCTAATQMIMSGLYPHIFSTQRNGKTMVACSLSGELHEMGIRMVTDFFEIEGWNTYYLGANMPDRQLQEALTEHNAHLLAISVTLPTHISKAAALIKQIKSNPDLSELKILVGGYPFLNNPDLWKKTGADGFAENARQAIVLAEQLTGLQVNGSNLVATIEKAQDDILQITNEQQNPTPRTDKKLIPLQRIGKREINEGLLNDFSLLNNELINKQRELYQKNAQIQLLNKQLEAATENMKIFAYSVSHDLKEPVRMVHSFMNLFHKKFGDTLDEKAQTYVHFAMDGARRLEGMINDLLEYYRASGITSDETVDLNTVVDEVLRLLQKQIADSSAKVTVSPLPVLPGSHTGWRQIFQNLVSNAIKFVAEDRLPEIDISATQTDQGWYILISDNGIGIEPEFHGTVFNHFKRAHYNTNYEGTGMGLAIVKKIVNNFEGTIQLESEPGKGTTFMISIARVSV